MNDFKGRQMSNESVYSLAAIVSAIFCRYHCRSMSWTNSNETNNHLFDSNKSYSCNLLIDLTENSNVFITEPISTNVIRHSDKFHIVVNDFRWQTPCNISLAAMTLDFYINDHIQTVQLISFEGDGRLKLQFEGTIVMFAMFLKIDT